MECGHSGQCGGTFVSGCDEDMASGESESEESEGLVGLAPELVHRVALSGWLEVGDVAALSLTCRRMAEILVWDGYGRDLHRALVGVVENMRVGRWRSARYAVNRGWFAGGGERGWQCVVGAVVGDGRIVLENEEDVAGWEDVVLAALSLDEGVKQASLLHVAAGVGSVRVVDWVWERGGDLEVENGDGLTPLYVACEAGTLRVVKALVERGADLKTMGPYGTNLLYAAALHDNVDVLRYLLETGALDVDEEDHDGDTPLINACAFGRLDVVKVLVEVGGAEVDVALRGRGPLYWACDGGHMDVVRFLLEAGAWGGLEADGGVGISAMLAGAERGRVEVVRLWLDLGLDVDGVDGGGDTVLFRASRGSHVELVRMLVEEAGADVDKAGYGGMTPLYVASTIGNVDIVRMLLDAGADVEICDGGGETPLRVARRRRRDGVVEVLTRYRPPEA